MADEKAQEAETDKGLSPGVSNSDLDEGQSRTQGAPAAPEVRNTPPEPTADQKAKEAEAQKIEADAKTKADNEAAEKAKTEEGKQDATTEDETPEPTEFMVYNDDAADSAIAMLKEGGVTPTEADKFFREAIESNDLSKIDVAGLTAKLGKEKANLVVLGVTDFYNRQTAVAQASVQAVHETVGGADKWNLIKEWAVKKAESDPAFKAQMAEYSQMFDLNKAAAVAAGKEMSALYDADSNNKSLNTKMVHGDKSASTGNIGSEPLSRADYVEQLKAAHAKNDTAEVTRLNAQRLATKQSAR